MNVVDKIIFERELVLVFNYAYEVLGEGLVKDSVYEYGIQNLRELRENFPVEWESCGFYHEYFVKNDDWEYTGSGVPRGGDVKSLYDNYIKRVYGKAVRRIS